VIVSEQQPRSHFGKPSHLDPEDMDTVHSFEGQAAEIFGAEKLRKNTVQQRVVVVARNRFINSLIFLSPIFLSDFLSR
jgi:hypothetical protein